MDDCEKQIYYVRKTGWCNENDALKIFQRMNQINDTRLLVARPSRTSGDEIQHRKKHSLCETIKGGFHLRGKVSILLG